MIISAIGREQEALFCHGIDYKGHCETVASKDGVDLRKIEQSGNFQPIRYENRPLLFYTLQGESELNASRTGEIEVTYTLLTSHYEDYKVFLAMFDSYSFPTIKIRFGSVNIYNDFFKENPDRPFTNFAFQIITTQNLEV